MVYLFYIKLLVWSSGNFKNWIFCHVLPHAPLTLMRYTISKVHILSYFKKCCNVLSIININEIKIRFNEKRTVNFFLDFFE